MDAERLAQVRKLLDSMNTDPEELERLRKATLIPLLEARGIPIPDREGMDSYALRKLLHEADSAPLRRNAA